ncbi:hypothetical protein TIFTF001_020753 [Ficus carica]|uniref:Uncharacterized protein n=1 Tax=Ficus carica TaxID=3494 RepID=A0AA88DA46_FICCA|nr:hypothetical protein TIFTF001_020753 [Ficus carica]
MVDSSGESEIGVGSWRSLSEPCRTRVFLNVWAISPVNRGLVFSSPSWGGAGSRGGGDGGGSSSRGEGERWLGLAGGERLGKIRLFVDADGHPPSPATVARSDDDETHSRESREQPSTRNRNGGCEGFRRRREGIGTAKLRDLDVGFTPPRDVVGDDGVGRPLSTIGADLENNPPSDLRYHGDAARKVADAGKLATLAEMTRCHAAGGGRDSRGQRPLADGCWSAVVSPAFSTALSLWSLALTHRL